MSLSAEYHLLDALRNLDVFSVPGLGSFHRRYVPAYTDAIKGIIQAPREEIIFSENTSAAGIQTFKNFLACEGNPASGYPEAADEISRQIQHVLSANGAFHIKNLGRLNLTPSGIQAEWVQDIHQRIFSNLHGFKDIVLPQALKENKEPRFPKPDVRTEAKPEIKPVAPVVAPPPPVQQESVIKTVPAPAKPEPKPEPVKPETTFIPNEPVLAPQGIGPSQKALHEKGTAQKRKKRLPFVMILVSMLILMTVALLYYYPLYFNNQTRSEVVPVLAEEKNNTPENTDSVETAPLPEALPPVESGYYLIVSSSQSEADMQNASKIWTDKGFSTEILPPDENSEFYRLSILKSQNRAELVSKMIELKEQTYSWILKQP